MVGCGMLKKSRVHCACRKYLLHVVVKCRACPFQPRATVTESTPMKALIETIESGAHLSREQVFAAGEALLSEDAGLEEKARFLTALSERGEAPEEIAFFAQSFLEKAVDPGLKPGDVGGPLMDVCGTGGDKLNLFNISTTWMFVLAAAGAVVVKHGNRGITSKSGGADVLEYLGVKLDLPPERFVEGVKQTGLGFLFAPAYHPAFKSVAPVRKMLAERGQRTMFNILGPLLNPVRPDYQLIGVFSEHLQPGFAEILTLLGRKSAWVVHGKTEAGAGMDEVSVSGPTQVWKTESGKISHETLEPASLGVEVRPVGELKGGDAAANASLLTGILSGEIRDAKRDVVLLNAAAGLTVCGKASNMEEGLQRAAELIDSGAAKQKLDAFLAFHS